MEWKKVPPEMVALLDEVMKGFAAERKSMFGCPVYFVNNNMFAGVHGSSFFFRLSEEDREALFAVNDEITVFEPMEGRPMKEYVVLPDTLLHQEAFLMEWLRKSYAFVSQMPAKGKKVKKEKKIEK